MTTTATIVLFAIGAFLISFISAWLGAIIALQPLGKPPPVFWVERARLSYPARLVAATNTILLPMWLTGIAWSTQLSVPASGIDGAYIGGAAVGAFVGALLVVAWVEHRVYGTSFSMKTWCCGALARLLLLFPQFGVLVVMIYLTPDTLDLRAVAIMCLSAILLAISVSGAGVFLVRILGLAREAPLRLAAIVKTAAARFPMPPRATYEIVWTAANAIAIPLWRRLVVTDEAVALLNDEELMTVCVHELAHLNEPRAILVLRIVGGSIFWLALIAIRPIFVFFGPAGLGTMIIMVVVVVVAVRRLARRMEERADAIASLHQGEEGAYARALERLHEANLVPAVMSGKRRVHPHLYDRLVAAGMQPAYPRPAPPPRFMQHAAILITMVVASILFGAASVAVLVARNLQAGR